jgi:hypothetical protein
MKHQSHEDVCNQQIVIKQEPLDNSFMTTTISDPSQLLCAETDDMLDEIEE